MNNNLFYESLIKVRHIHFSPNLQIRRSRSRLSCDLVEGLGIQVRILVSAMWVLSPGLVLLNSAQALLALVLMSIVF